MQNGDAATITVDVKNNGNCYGEEVVQIYVSSDCADKDRPVKLLKGYKRVGVNSGSTVTAEISVCFDDIKFLNPDEKNWELDKSYTVFAGNSSRNVKEIGKLAF